MTDKKDDLRYELKIPYNASRLHEVRAWLQTHPWSFHQAYPPRQVNNIYYDLPGMALLLDHLDGVESRYKIRYRWYGQEVSAIQGVLEIKYKDNLVGWKDYQPIETSLDLACMTWSEVTTILANHTTGWVSEVLPTSIPVLINRYQREYFVSADGSARVTFDYDLNIFHQQMHMRPNLFFREPRDNSMLIEIKSETKNSSSLADLLAGFPLRVGRFSKYVNSMDALTERLIY